VAVDFEKIPECVWKLFDSIMWADPENRGRKVTLTPRERTDAMVIAWGWSPPLLKQGSRTELTWYGLAAYRWRKNVPADAVWLGGGRVRIGDETIALEFAESTVLEALVQKGAATRPDLEKASGVDDVKNIMKKLKKRFPDHIKLPGGRGKGGYRTTIKPCADEQQP